MAPKKRKLSDVTQPKLAFGRKPVENRETIATSQPPEPTGSQPPEKPVILPPLPPPQESSVNNLAQSTVVDVPSVVMKEDKEGQAKLIDARKPPLAPAVSRPKMSDKERIRTELAKVEELERIPEAQEGKDLGEIEFQLLDADEVVKEAEVGSLAYELPLIRLFGCTRSGQSLLVVVRDFHPYFFFPVSAFFGDKDLAEFLEHCREKVSDVVIKAAELVTRTPLMYYRPDSGDKYSHFLRITVSLPKHVGTLSRYLCSGKLGELFGREKYYDTQAYEANVNYVLRLMIDKDMAGGGWITIPQGKYASLKAETASSRCEVNVVCSFRDLDVHPVADGTKRWSGMAPLRTLTLSAFVLLPSESQISSSSSAQEPPSKKRKAGQEAGKKDKGKGKGKASSDQEDDNDAENNDDESEESDKEEGEQEPLSFIAAIANIKGNLTTVVFTHRADFHEPEGAKLLVFDSEKQMLLAWKELFLKFDADILTGFDSVENMALILERAEKYGLTDYPYFGRVETVKSTAKRAQLYRAGWIRSQRRMANNSNEEFLIASMIGRVSVDLKQVTERTSKLRSYSFAEVCQETFNITKETFDSRIITALFKGTAEEHVRLLKYVVREVTLAQNLFDKSAALYNSVEMARVTGLNLSDVMEKGQMIRFWSQLFRYCRKKDYVIPTIKGGNSGMQLGAVNLMPDVGYYTKDPVAVLDFASLYPSIIIGHNLCYSTLIHTEDKKHFKPDELTEGATGAGHFHFVKSSLKKGVVPEILETFLSERQKAKKMMEETTDSDMKAVLEGRQLALKVSANAIYGFTGAQSSKLQCLPIAECTIDFGAQLMMGAKEMIENAVIFGVHCKVVYGDTDSLFVSFPGCSVKTAIEYSQTLALEMSERFIKPIKLKFEKVYFPCILLQKKRYAGLQWTRPEAPDKVDVKGVENTNRGSSGVLIKTLDKVFDIIHPHRSNDPRKSNDMVSPELRTQVIKEAVAYTKEAIRGLLSGNIDMGELIMTKALWLGTDAEDYKVKQAHVELAERIRKRDPERIFKSGERVPYVYVQSSEGDKGYHKTEDPVYVMQHGIPVDLMYYYEHQLKEPLRRIFQVLLPDDELNQLLGGEHTRVINTKYTGGTLPSTAPTQTGPAAAPSSAAGPPRGPEKKGITAFFNKSTTTTTCLGCKARIPSETSICKTCAPRATEIRDKLVEDASRADEKKRELVQTCLTCQGCDAWDIICVNTECPVFYRRPKAVAEASKLNHQLENLKW